MKASVEVHFGKETYWYSNESLNEIYSDGSDSALTNLANALRLNSLSMIQVAGSGHPGTSLSVADIAVAAHFSLGSFDDGSEALLFSSKGHDAPMMYSLLSYSGLIEQEKLRMLRRLNGLPGHPDIAIPGIKFNTGSLGLGISKAKGYTTAQRRHGKKDPRIVTILGDGELQEGQIWESMLSAARDDCSRLIAIVDANQIQSDKRVVDTLNLGDLKKRVEGSGWKYVKVDGHSHSDLRLTLKNAWNSPGPHFIQAETLKGAGVGFMMDFPDQINFYPFHSGSLPEELYVEAINELQGRIKNSLNARDSSISTKLANAVFQIPKPRPNNLVLSWARKIQEIAEKDSNIIVLDADLSLDTGTYLVAKELPNQYVQCGIAEQDMFSQASGMAMGGLRPFVHSFSCFLIRATEQCFNNATEKTSITYVGTLAGVLPSMPGHSHQAVSDVGIMQSIPGMQIFEPSCSAELEFISQVLPKSEAPSYLRINSFSKLEDGDEVKFKGLTRRREGEDGLFLGSSPSLITEALIASSSLISEKISWGVYTYPWLSEDPTPEDLEVLRQFTRIIVLEDHLPSKGISTMLNKFMIKHKRLGPIDIPPCGQPMEVLKSLKLDSESLTLEARLMYA